MQGRDRFTKAEAEQIRQLLGSMSLAGTGRQKSVRQKLRAIGFYITDYEDAHRGFSVADFDQLVTSGRVAITD